MLTSQNRRHIECLKVIAAQYEQSLISVSFSHVWTREERDVERARLQADIAALKAGIIALGDRL